MMFTRNGIGSKLFLAFSTMAALTLIAVMIGVAGFSRRQNRAYCY